MRPATQPIDDLHSQCLHLCELPELRRERHELIDVKGQALHVGQTSNGRREVPVYVAG